MPPSSRPPRPPTPSSPEWGGRSVRTDDPIIGREPELHALEDAVAGGARFVTLVGMGGIGKTRLALSAAERLSAAGAAHACFCDLSGTRSANDMCAAVARALDVRAPGAEPLARRIGERLANGPPSLVVLDNFEQLGDDAAEIVEGWQRAAASAIFLVTTRRTLGTRSELVVPVAPLGIPAPEDLNPLDIEESDAVRLFLARAAPRLYGALLPEHDAHLVADVVRRLEGIPLAIELAAARLDVLTIDALAEGLNERFQILRDPVSSRDERHATLFRTIDWSWQLLEPWQRTALAEASVFAGTFDLNDAAAVIALPHAAQAPTVLDAIHALVRHSLIHVEVMATARHAARFSLSVTVREFAAHNLTEEDAAAVRERHAHHFIARGRAAAREHDARGALDVVRRVERDRADLMAILARAESERPATEESAARAAGAMLALSPLLFLRSPADAHLALLDGAENAVHAARAPALRGYDARLELTRAQLLRQMGHAAEARDAIDRALPVARALGARTIEGMLLAEQADCHLSHDEPEQARARADEAAAVFQETGDARQEALVLVDRAYAESALAEFDAAASNAERALSLFRAHGDARDEAWAHVCLGSIAFARGDFVTARGHVEDARARHDYAPERRHAAVMFGLTGVIAHATRDVAAARDAYEEARRAFEDVGDRRLAATYDAYAGLVALQCGEIDLATTRLARARDVLARLGDERAAPRVAAALAGARALRGDIAGAAWELTAIEESLTRGADARLVIDVYRGVIEAIQGDMRAARRRAADLALLPGNDLRLALPLLSRAIADADERTRAWRFAPDDAQFCLPGGDTVSLATRPSLARIAGALARHRVQEPGAPVPKVTLVREAWPDEPRLSPLAANNRLKVAMSTLRKLGLEAILVTRDGGYLLDPEVPVRVAPAL